MKVRRQDKLRTDWGKKEKDVVLHFPLGSGTRSDAHWLSAVFDKAFVEELLRRGYDPATLRFEVAPLPGDPKFASQRAGRN
jgi:hypothetical protein